jgi:hypothetical protein
MHDLALLVSIVTLEVAWLAAFAYAAYCSSSEGLVEDQINEVSEAARDRPRLGEHRFGSRSAAASVVAVESPGSSSKGQHCRPARRRFRRNSAGYERRMAGIDDPGLVPEPSPPPDEGTLATPPPDEGTPPIPPPDEGTLPTPDPVPDDPEAD